MSNISLYHSTALAVENDMCTILVTSNIRLYHSTALHMG